MYETITFDKEDEENVLVLKASVEETWGKLYLTVLKVAKELSNHSNQVPTIPHMVRNLAVQCILLMIGIEYALGLLYLTQYS